MSATDGCQGFELPALDVCKANKQGTYCTTIDKQISMSYLAASSDCTDERTCEEGFTKTLRNITNTIGCCFNEKYNATNQAITGQEIHYWWL